LNRYPQLKGVFNNYLNGYFANIELEYVHGITPTAYVFDENGNQIEEFILGDFGLEEFKRVLSEHGFELKRPELPKPELVAETNIGGIRYQFFGKGQLYQKEATEFAASLSHNGQSGRLLSIPCRQQEDKISEWIKSMNYFDTVSWISASRNPVEGTWHWSNGDLIWSHEQQTNAKYGGWRRGEPNNANENEPCATWSVHGWNDTPCATEAHIIVEFGPDSSTECDVLSDVSSQSINHNQGVDL